MSSFVDWTEQHESNIADFPLVPSTPLSTSMALVEGVDWMTGGIGTAGGGAIKPDGLATGVNEGQKDESRVLFGNLCGVSSYTENLRRPCGQIRSL